MSNPSPLQHDTCYHIYNRGTNGESLFLEDSNFAFFLERYVKYIEPVACTYAYCLMKNHFHFLIRTKTPEEPIVASSTPGVTKHVLQPSRQFARLFTSYAKAFNRRYGRTGSLFEHPFHRIKLRTESHLQCLVAYIHRNPQRHGFVSDFRAWPHSSYKELTSQGPTRLQREAVLDWFGALEGFLEFHASGIKGNDVRSIALE